MWMEIRIRMPANVNITVGGILILIPILILIQIPTYYNNKNTSTTGWQSIYCKSQEKTFMEFLMFLNLSSEDLFFFNKTHNDEKDNI